jgi:hypothetical protein
MGKSTSMRRIRFRYVLPAANLIFVAIALYVPARRLAEIAGTINFPAALLTAQVDRLFDLFMYVYPTVPPWRAAFEEIFLVIAMILQWFALGWFLDRSLGILPPRSVSLKDALEGSKEAEIKTR